MVKDVQMRPFSALTVPGKLNNHYLWRSLIEASSSTPSPPPRSRPDLIPLYPGSPAKRALCATNISGNAVSNIET